MTLVIEVLVYVAIGLALLSSWLMLRMRDAYQMMHFMSPPASVSALLISIAIFLQRGVKPESFKALFVAAVLILMNAVVTQATARAFRIRAQRDWRTRDDEEVPTMPTDESLNEAIPGKP